MGIKLLARPNEDGFEIVGNRDGLRRLAEVCLDLADLPKDTAEAQKMGARLPSLCCTNRSMKRGFADPCLDQRTSHCPCSGWRGQVTLTR
jgi:hypothetical protein